VEGVSVTTMLTVAVVGEVGVVPVCEVVPV